MNAQPRRRPSRWASLPSPRPATLLASLAALMLTIGCTTTRPRPPQTPHQTQRAFWTSLESLCGRAFEGKVVEDTTNSPDFAGNKLVMHVRKCDGGRVFVPFHVGEDRSRTWVFTQTGTGLRLKHDHRHEDGTEDEITQYGGDTNSPGSLTVQEFHADAHTATIIPAAVTNVWTVEISPGSTFVYSLRREGTSRRFRVEFDLTRPVTPPPAPWGHR